jgi:hypothetical protein
MVRGYRRYAHTGVGSWKSPWKLRSAADVRMVRHASDASGICPATVSSAPLSRIRWEGASRRVYNKQPVSANYHHKCRRSTYHALKTTETISIHSLAAAPENEARAHNMRRVTLDGFDLVMLLEVLVKDQLRAR